MADNSFFQPGPSTQESVGTATPSPAQQAMMRFKAEMLQRMLASMGGPSPSFQGWAQGTGPLNRGMPSGLGDSMGAVLEAMAQPGAFTSQETRNTEMMGAEPSMLSDIMQMAQLGSLVYNSGALGKLADLFKHGDSSQRMGLPGIEGSSGVSPVGALTSTGNPELDALIMGNYGGGMDTAGMIPGGDMSTVPANYPGLADDTSWLSGLFS